MSDGLEIEGDVKHVARLMKDLGMEDCQVASTPGVNGDDPDSKECESRNDRGNMSSSDATMFRKCAARINYMAQDRGDLSFAAKVNAQRMSTPKIGDETALKRVVRYLQLCPRMCLRFT